MLTTSNCGEQERNILQNSFQTQDFIAGYAGRSQGAHLSQNALLPPKGRTPPVQGEKEARPVRNHPQTLGKAFCWAGRSGCWF